MPIDLWGVAACAALTVIAYLLGVAPLRQRHADLQERRRALAQKTQEANDLAGNMRQLAGRVTNLQRQVAENPLRLQPSQQLNSRLAEVTSAAGECGLDVNDIQPGNPVIGARHTLVPINLAGAGSYRNCVEFLHRFHARFADSGVANFALARNPAEPSSRTSFQFRLIWYVEPQSASAR